MDFGLGVLLEAKDLFSGAFTKAGASFRDFEGATSTAGKRITDHLKNMGTGLAIFGAGVAGLLALRAPLAAASEYGTQLGNIRTIVDEATFSTAALEDATMDLAATYGGGPIKQAASLYETISAGVMDATDAVELMAVANEFAVGGSAELAAGVDVLTSAVNTYADTSLTARDASDALFVAIAAGKTTASELSHSLGEVAPTAHAMGVSFDELTAAIAALTVQGIKTPQAVTALNAMLANIAKPSKDAADEAKRLGIEFNTTALKARGLAGFLAQLNGNAKVNDDTFAKLFGSIDGIKGALSLTSNNGAKLSEVLAQMQGKTGATKKAFDIMAQTMGFQEQRFASLKESALVLIGQALEPLAATVLGVVNRIVEGFIAIPAPIREFIVRAFAAAAAVTALVGAALAAKSAIAVAVAGLKAAGVTAAGLVSALGPVVAALAVVGLAFAAFREAYERNLGGIAAWLDRSVASTKLAMQALGQAFSDGGFSGAVREELNKAENAGIKNFVIRLYVTLGRIQEFLSQLSESFSATIGEAEPAFTAFTKAVEQLGGAFDGLSEAMNPGEASATFEAYGKGGATVGKVFAILAITLTRAVTAILELAAGIAPVLKPIGDYASTVIGMWKGVFAELGQIAAELGLVDEAVSGNQSSWVSLGKAIGSVIAYVVNVTKSLVSTVGSVLNGAINIVGGILEMFTGNFQLGLTRVLYGIMSIISGVVLGAIDLLATAADAVLGTEMSKRTSKWKTDFDEVLRRTTGLNNQVEKAEQAREDARQVMTPMGSVVAPAAAELMASFPGAAVTEASAAAAQPDFSGLYASMEALADRPPPAQSIAVKIAIDGEELASRVESAQVSRADRGFASGIPLVD